MGGGTSGAGSEATCHGKGGGGKSAPPIGGADEGELSHAGSASSSGGTSTGVDAGDKARGTSFRGLCVGCGCNVIPLGGLGAGGGPLGAKTGGGNGCGGGIAAWNGIGAGGGA